MAAVTHFEIYAEKPEGLADFYRSRSDGNSIRPPGSNIGILRTMRRTQAASTAV